MLSPNSTLALLLQAGHKVVDVYEEFRDGSKLLLLLELLTGNKLVSTQLCS